MDLESDADAVAYSENALGNAHGLRPLEIHVNGSWDMEILVESARADALDSCTQKVENECEMESVVPQPCLRAQSPQRSAYGSGTSSSSAEWIPQTLKRKRRYAGPLGSFKNCKSAFMFKEKEILPRTVLQMHESDHSHKEEFCVDLTIPSCTNSGSRTPTAGSNLCDMASESINVGNVAPASPTSSHRLTIRDRTVLIFPAKGVRGAVSITEADVELLASRQWANDTLIEYYLKYIGIHAPSYWRGRIYCMSPFFLEVLMRPNHESDTSRGSAHVINYDAVKRWTSDVDLFTKRDVFISACWESHWYLYVIAHLDSRMMKANEFRGWSRQQQRPQVLIYDSLKKKTNTEHVVSIQEFFGNEMRSRHPSEYSMLDWRYSMERTESSGKSRQLLSSCLAFDVVRVNGPKQKNGSDCGFFVMKFIQQFLQDPVCSPTLGRHDILDAHCSEWNPPDVTHWFCQEDVTTFRDELRDQIECMAEHD